MGVIDERVVNIDELKPFANERGEPVLEIGYPADVAGIHLAQVILFVGEVADGEKFAVKVGRA